MKIYFKLMAALAVLLIIANGFPAFTVRAEDKGAVSSGETQMFCASVEYSFQGYVVKGSLTELISDIRVVQPVYSLNGQTWQPCGVEWNLNWLSREDSCRITDLQNQICIYNNMEPLKSYLAGRLDRFYLKLRITRENGIICETNAAVIERKAVQQVPEEITFVAAFTPSMRVFERNPFHYYGRYQMYINAGTAPQEISALLPDTIPVEIQINKGNNFIASGVVDCPVRWKPLPLIRLTAGEAVTIPDAAEELVIPAGTLVSTPIGVYSLNEPLKVAQDAIMTDEIRLMLNVLPETGKAPEVPSGESSRGAGGNEANAGADNKKDSTEEGQRPDLPQTTENETGEQQSAALHQSGDKSQSPLPNLWYGSGIGPEEQRPDTPSPQENEPEGQQPDLSEDMKNVSDAPFRQDVTFSNAFFFESPQSQQDIASDNGFECSMRMSTAEAIADNCISVVAVRMKANMISGRMIPQIAVIVNMMLLK